MKTKIIGLNRIVGGWCRYYQTTSSPSQVFKKLETETFWEMAHWLGRKFKMSVPEVMRKFKKGSSIGTGTYILSQASEFKAKRHGLREITNPYTTKDTTLRREDFDNLEGEWLGTEVKKG